MNTHKICLGHGILKRWVTDGCFYGEGAFRVNPAPNPKDSEDLFRSKFLRCSKPKARSTMLSLKICYPGASAVITFMAASPSHPTGYERRDQGRSPVPYGNRNDLFLQCIYRFYETCKAFSHKVGNYAMKYIGGFWILLFKFL